MSLKVTHGEMTSIMQVPRWLIAALSVRYAGGFTLRDSAGQMGAGLFAQLTALRFAALDWLYIAAAPVLAFVLANAGAANGRRQSP